MDPARPDDDDGAPPCRRPERALGPRPRASPRRSRDRAGQGARGRRSCRGCRAVAVPAPSASVKSASPGRRAACRGSPRFRPRRPRASRGPGPARRRSRPPSSSSLRTRRARPGSRPPARPSPRPAPRVTTRRRRSRARRSGRRPRPTGRTSPPPDSAARRIPRRAPRPPGIRRSPRGAGAARADQPEAARRAAAAAPGRPTSGPSRCGGPGIATISPPSGRATHQPGAVPFGFGRAVADGISHACLRLISGKGRPRRSQSVAQPALEVRVDGRRLAEHRRRSPRGSGRPASDRARRSRPRGRPGRRRSRRRPDRGEVVGQRDDPPDRDPERRQLAGEVAGIRVPGLADRQLGADAEELGRQDRPVRRLGSHVPQPSARASPCGRPVRHRRPVAAVARVPSGRLSRNLRAVPPTRRRAEPPGHEC